MRHFETETALALQLVKDGHILSTTVQGHSMVPTLLEGDSLSIEPVDPDEVVPGDILAYNTKGRLIAHVLCFTLSLGKRRWLFLKGTANRRGDLPVPWEDVVGRVMEIQRGKTQIPLKRSPVEPVGLLAWISLFVRFLRGTAPGIPLVKGVVR